MHNADSNMYSTIICLLFVLNRNSYCFFCQSILFFIHFLLKIERKVPLIYHRISSGFLKKHLLKKFFSFGQKFIQLMRQIQVNNIKININMCIYTLLLKIANKVKKLRKKILHFISLFSPSNSCFLYQR